MSVLDQVMDLKSQGIRDSEISSRLQEEGISPGEINDALGRAQIKSAVSDTGTGTEGMQPSILGNEDGQELERLPLEGLEGGTLSDEDLTPPRPGMYPMQPMPRYMTKEISQEEESEAYQPQEVYSPQPQLQAPQEGYEYAQYDQSAGVGDTDTMIEVAEQVFVEKNKPLQKKIDEMTEFRVLAQTKIENISDRLRRIETIIDKLQASILEKVGSYGSGLETVRKEMSMMQDSFGKIVNKVANATEAKHHTQHTSKAHPGHQTVHKSTKITRRRHSKK